jgi:serine/threonine-protein kinase
MRINLTVIEGPHEGREFSFDEHINFIVGRAKVAHFRLPIKDEYFSRFHFMVEVNPPLCQLIDLGSTNGTRVNGKKVTTAALKDGDRIKAGKTVIRVSLQGEQPTAISETSRFSAPFEHLAISQPTPCVSARTMDIRSPQIVDTLIPSAGIDENEVPCRVCGAPGSESHGLAAPCESGPLPLCPICRLSTQYQVQPISGYWLVRELGRGAMGVVFQGIRRVDGTVVAIKMIAPSLVGTNVQIERFLREARILGQLDHPLIVAFREMGHSNGQFYFAMDYVRGTDLARLQKERGGPLTIPMALDLTCQLLSALEYAHGKHFVHRDIKPANIMVEKKNGQDVLRLTDFGLARTYQSSPMSGLTFREDIGGTMDFIAPEQISDFRNAKPAADQYSAGATLYKLLSDRHVFELPREFRAQILMILQDDPVPIRLRRSDISEDLAAIVHRSLSKLPTARFPDVAAMKTALLRFVQRH